MSTLSYPAIPQEQHYHDSANPFNAKIMVVAVACLLVITSFVLLLHVYAKWWFFTQSRGRRLSLPDLQPPPPPPMLSQQLHRLSFDALYDTHVGDHGLDSGVIASLPTFVYKKDGSGIMKAGLECVVCLSLFEENEKGRILPKCHHPFHVDCIDMWLMSHSTCPLCRNLVAGMEEAAVVQSPSQPMVDSAMAHGMLDGNSQLQVEVVVEVPVGLRFDSQGSKDSSSSSSSSSTSSSSCTLSESLKRMLSRSRSESRVFPSSDHVIDR